MSRPVRADWQLPAGVNRGLWDYVRDTALARGYDAGLAGSALGEADLEFVRRHCPPGRLIDLGCGTGRLLVKWAGQGGWVLGVDLSAEMLKVAREKAVATGAAVQLLRANLVELDAIKDESFDGAACLFSTLGMVCGTEERRRVVRHAYRLLRPGGVFVLHVHNRWFNVWDRPGRRWLVGNALASWVGRAVAGDREMPAHQGLAGLTLHLFTRREVRRLLTEAGFRVREVKQVGLRPDGSLRWPWWFGGLRAYGYLMAAQRPE